MILLHTQIMWYIQKSFNNEIYCFQKYCVKFLLFFIILYIFSDLIWMIQINEVVSKATSMAGWALRTFRTRKELPMITIWNSLVRPCLDYCSPVWSPRPSNFHEIDLLEQTQRSFTRQINGMEGLDYARLKKLHMYSIQRRNERFKIIYMYKIKRELGPKHFQ